VLTKFVVKMVNNYSLRIQKKRNEKRGEIVRSWFVGTL